jgi:hypothetical protein
MSRLGGVFFFKSTHLFPGCRFSEYASHKCMRRSYLRNALNAVFGVTLVVAACRPAKPLSAFGREIDHQFGRPIVVSAARHGQLILIVPPAKDTTQADTTDPSVLAHSVAQFALEHSQRPLKSVTVVFDAGDDDSTATHTNYTWSADELSGKKHVTAGTPGQRSD